MVSLKGMVKYGMVLLLPFLILAGCGGRAEDSNEGKPSSAGSGGQKPSIRAVVLVDKTGSAEAHGIPSDLSSEGLEPILDAVRRRGGEVAVGLISEVIGEEGFRPLMRIRVNPPPSPPASGSNSGENVWSDLRRQSRLSKFQDSLKARRQRVTSKMRHYRTQLDSLLATSANSKVTDIGGALRRASVFLQEPFPMDRKVQEFVLLLTDGKDTTSDGSTPSLHTKGATWVLINGVGACNYICEAGIDPVQFGSLPATSEWVVTQASPDSSPN